MKEEFQTLLDRTYRPGTCIWDWGRQWEFVGSPWGAVGLNCSNINPIPKGSQNSVGQRLNFVRAVRLCGVASCQQSLPHVNALEN